MSTIEFERVVSYSSEDPKYPAQNLLKFGNKWKCKTPGEPNATVILQMDQPRIIYSIDIGNEHSAFVNVFVGRAASDDYQMILPASSFMTAEESSKSINPNRVRMFKDSDLVKNVAKEKWDRVKIVCSQPFNRRVQYGLSFIVFRYAEKTNNSNNLVPSNLDKFNEKKKDDESTVNLGRFHLKDDDDDDDISVGSLFAKRKDLHMDEEEHHSSLYKTALSLTGRDHPKKDKVSSANDKQETKNTHNESNKTQKPSPVPRPNSPQVKPKVVKQNENVKPKVNTPISKRQQKSPNSSDKTLKRTHPTSEKQIETKRPKVPVTPKQKKPFNKLFEGVVFTISGYVNPARSIVRSKALEMGAKYRPDWDSSCTHLICAFKDTPKFKQVKGHGRIVLKDWIEQCHAKRKRIPWRRFALDITDFKKPESEDEIVEDVPEQQNTNRNALGSNSTSVQHAPSHGHGSDQEIDTSSACKAVSGSDTEEEIEKMQATKAVSHMYMSDTEEEEDTKPDTRDLPLPELPD